MSDHYTAKVSGELGAALAGRYVVDQAIGVGGMAIVYLATDVRHDRRVAIKVMRPEIAGLVSGQRFLREIAISAKLTHPGIVPLYDSGQAGDHLFYVMPYIEGQSLGTLLAEPARPRFDETLRIIGDVADALTYAHTRGIIHRDIKPDNVLLASGRALVADFGIAKALESATDEPVTTTRIAVGTPQYMSPEQKGGATTVDHRSDLYSLALILKEMLGPDAPETVRPVLARALEPEPANRFATVAAFAAALRDAATDPGIPRPRFAATLIALGAVAAAATIIAIAWDRSANGTVQQAGNAAIGRIIVAPLENRSGDTALNVVGLMAGDWMTEGLQKTGLLEVVPTASAVPVSRYVASAQDTRGPMRAIASEAGATTVVGGAFYGRGDTLLFRVTVADQQGGRVVGTLPDVAAPKSDPLRAVEELRNRLMGWLAITYDPRLEGPGLEARPPTYEAYRAFSEGMARYIDVDNAGALQLFLRAAQIDTSFTTAMLYASICLTNMAQFARADTLLQQVDRKRATMSEYHQAWLDYRMAFVRNDRTAALAAIRRAAHQAPESKSAYNHTVEAFQTGHVREAKTAAAAIDPERGAMRGFAPYYTISGAIFHALGDYDGEMELGERALRTYPDRLWQYAPVVRSLAAKGRVDTLTRLLDAVEPLKDPTGLDHGRLLVEAGEELRAHGRAVASIRVLSRAANWLEANPKAPQAEWRLAQTQYALGRWDAARETTARLRRRDPTNAEYLGMAGLLSGRAGRGAEARAIADSLTGMRRPHDFGIATYYRARIAAVLNEREQAVALLRQSMNEGRSYHLWLHRDADLEALRGYGPFEELVKGRT